MIVFILILFVKHVLERSYADRAVRRQVEHICCEIITTVDRWRGTLHLSGLVSIFYFVD